MTFVSQQHIDRGFHFVPGSDDEDSTVEIPPRQDGTYGVENTSSVFRGNQDGPLFILSSASVHEGEISLAGGQFVYESIMMLWLQKWSDHFYMQVEDTENPLQRGSRRAIAFPLPRFDPLRPSENILISFFDHMDLFLPICLKSVALRYSVEVLPLYPPATKVLLDKGHETIFEGLVEMLARGLVGFALAGIESSSKEENLFRAVSASEGVVDFIVGLIPILHAEHMRAIISKYLKTLKDTETEHLGGSFPDIEFSWTEESLVRVRCSRQLRLAAIEAFASVPSFCNINVPCKLSEELRPVKPRSALWLRQYHSGERSKSTDLDISPKYPDGVERLPLPGWLSDIVVDEALSVCSLSSEAVVAEALAHIEVSRQDANKGVASSLKKRPGAALQRDDLLMFQSLSIHAITVLYELILRRHALDRRFQSDSARSRLAAMFARPILDKSISSVRWLARMEATHKVRSLWLLCFVYVLQETPDTMMQEYIRSCCDPQNIRIHRFIRLLRICSSTFQAFVDRPRNSSLPSEIDNGMSSWLLQESFNCICSTTNTVVDACVEFTSRYPQEKRKIMQGLIDLLLHILTTPQSSVTHLRAVGGALQAMDQFGVDVFLEVTGNNFQHWLRVLLSLTNSPSLSVRSIAVDFMVSLIGGAFDSNGTIDEVALVLATVLPEVVAREVALYNVSNQVLQPDDVARCVWPMRRALTDIQDANPLDDDRVDPHLSPILKSYGRAWQAIIDGVLIEMGLQDRRFLRFSTPGDFADVFSSDEESLFEAATFFTPETAPLQRVRWLMTLSSLHERNERWIEAAEARMLCAETISRSFQYLKGVWRPTNFALWTDSTRSHWLGNVGEDVGQPDLGNREVMDFANSFLEPDELLMATSKKVSASGRLQQPSVGVMCEVLNARAKEATDLYLKETGCEELALQRLEGLQRAIVSNFDESSRPVPGRGLRGRRRQVEDEAILRRMLANISVASARFSERVLKRIATSPTQMLIPVQPRVYVAIRVSGKKIKRFEETVALPPFVEWNEYCICSLSSEPLLDESGGSSRDLDFLLTQFAEPFLKALQSDKTSDVQLWLTPLRHSPGMESTVLEVFVVDPDSPLQSRTWSSRRFSYRKAEGVNLTALDFTVAVSFPCALSRQRSVVTTELTPRN